LETIRGHTVKVIYLKECYFIRDDEALYHELNVERYELIKSGKILFNHPQGTNDDRFWALALALYASEQAQSASSKPIAKII